MFHSLRFLRAQLMLSTFNQRGTQLLADLALTPLATPRARAEALSRACRAVCQLHKLEPVLSGSPPQAPAIFVCNHLGYVDPVALCSLLPCIPIAKSEVASWPVIGGIARRMDVMFVRRGDPYSGMRALRSAVRHLKAGVSILNFPEGTTTRGTMVAFKRGVFGLSALTGVPVVPLSLCFESPELCWVDDEGLLPHYSSVMVGRTHRVHVEVGPALCAAPGESPAEVAERASRWIASARSAFYAGGPLHRHRRFDGSAALTV